MPTTNLHPLLHFNAEVIWKKGVTGKLSSSGLKTGLEVAIPSEYSGGIAGKWSPEQLFLGAVAGFFMTTFLSLAGRKKFQFVGFSCSARGKVEFINHTYSFTQIDVYPILTIRDESDEANAAELIRRTVNACLIGHSIISVLVYHPVLIDTAGNFFFLPAIYHEHLSFSETIEKPIPIPAKPVTQHT